MQTEWVKICPVCKGTVFETVMQCTDHTYSHQPFVLQQCPSCQLLLTNPRPGPNAIGGFYQSDEYISHNRKARSFFDWAYLKARNHTLQWKHKLIASRKATGAILDYGCGTGEFIHYMAHKDWGAYAVEPSGLARGKARQLAAGKPLPIYESLEGLGGKKFDVITLWHVLEHVPHPGQLLATLKAKLNEGGLVFVAVPNHESYDARHYKQHWAAYDVPRHFWHFAQANMVQLLQHNGLAHLETIPMKLDAYYVSLLSEKYKNNLHHNLATPFMAMRTAWKSNAEARKTSNYSSLTYIAGHA